MKNAALLSLVLPACLMLAPTSGWAAGSSFDLTGTNNTTAKSVGSSGGQTGVLESGAVLTVGGNNVAVTVVGNATITNNGTIDQDGATSKGRAIRDNTGGLTLTLNNNSTGTIESNGDDAFQMNVAGSTVTLNNSGTISALGTGSTLAGQAVDWNALNNNNGTYTAANILHNNAGGVITAADADAVRPGQNGVITNDGTIKGNSTGDTGNDGIDAQTNTGVSITNANANLSANANLIEGAAHGITGGNTVTTTSGAFTMSITNNSNGTIKGDDGSGINIDGFNANEVVTINNAGKILGNGVTGDGDGVDVDGLVNLTNSGTIKSLNSLDDTSEGITVGGGTIINTTTGTIEGSISTPAGNTGVGRGITLAGVDKNGNTSIPIEKIYADTTITNSGLIKGDSDSGIAIIGLSGTDLNGNTIGNHSVTITNNASGVIEGNSATTAVIDGSATAGAIGTASTNNETIINYGTIQQDGTGKAISLGSGVNQVTIFGGAASINGDISGGTSAGSNALLIDPNEVTNSGNLSGQSFTYSHVISNFATVQIASGTVNLSGTISGGTTTVTGTSSNLHLNSGITGAVILTSGGSLTGNGTVGNLTVNSGGILSPGNSPGVINAGNTTFNSGGKMILQVNTDGSTGSAGVNWDKLAVAGTLNVSSLSPTSTFQFQLQTLDGTNAANPLAIFDATVNHTWDNVITTTGGITGTFNANDFVFDATGFQNNLQGGTFQLVQDSGNANNLDLQFIAGTAVAPEPSTWALLIGGLGLLITVVRRRRQS